MIATLKGKVWDGRVANENVVDESVESYIAKGKCDDGGVWKENGPVDVVAVIVRDCLDMEIGNIKPLQRVKSCIQRLVDETSGTKLYVEEENIHHALEIKW